MAAINDAAAKSLKRLQADHWTAGKFAGGYDNDPGAFAGE